MRPAGAPQPSAPARPAPTRRQRPAPLPPEALAELRWEAEHHATTHLPAAKVRRLFANLDQAQEQLAELSRARASGGAASPADGNRP